ncbi:MAG: ATP-dependent Clp protease ATP-binding subunit, partial [Oscillospiraceae bacterium]|nr:ATP-dependent Clp protease ATP-binding subunit [Oscillospiraceae bacterium]
MQPVMCSRCKQNVAVIFITKIENGAQTQEGLCLKCARELNIKPVQDIMNRMGISEENLEEMSQEMMNAFGGAEELPDAGGDDEEDGKTATFPFLNKLFSQNQPEERREPRNDDRRRAQDARSEKPQKHKFLDAYCISLTAKAREGRLDRMIGRDEEMERVIQILNRRQKNNPCLIGEPGVGKTAIAEALAQKIASGDVPYKLKDKELYLLDMTALVAGTQFRGQFESRILGVLNEVREAGNV